MHATSEGTYGAAPTGAPPPLLSREWPLLVGIALGIAIAAVRGGLFSWLPWPAGFDWFEYVRAAHKLAQTDGEVVLRFRQPFYPALLGALGEALADYRLAGTAISTASFVAIAVASGIAARALAGPWAGGLAAASIAFAPTTVSAAHWINLYPLLGAALGAGIAAGLALVAVNPGSWRARVALALSSGLACGVALAIDWRGVVAVGQGLALVALAPRAPSRRWVRSRPVLAALFAVACCAGPALNAALDVSTQFSPLEQVQWQRQQIAGTALDEFAACRETDSLVNLPCVRELLRENGGSSTKVLPFHWALTAAMLVAGVALGRASRRQRAALGISGGVGFLYMFAVAASSPDIARYLLVALVPVAMIVPVGAARLSALVLGGSPRPAIGKRAILALAAWGALVRPSGGPLYRRAGEEAAYWLPGQVIATLREHIQEGDVLMDCAWLNIESGFLPHVYSGGRIGEGLPPILQNPHVCEVWTWRDSAPTGKRAWLVTGAGGPVAGDTPLPHWELVASWEVPECPGTNCTVWLWAIPGVDEEIGS